MTMAVGMNREAVTIVLRLVAHLKGGYLVII